MTRIQEIAHWVGLLVKRDQLTELRVIGVGGEIWAGWFSGDDLERMAATALEFEQKAKGVYFIPNPIKPHGKSLDMGRRGKGETTDDEMIERRRWLLVDIDPVRFGPDKKPLADTNCPSTDAEREAAWQVLLRCRDAFDAFGVTEPIIGDSGNGFHLCYPINLPNDESARQLHKSILGHLDNRSGDEFAHVDLKTFNAARIWKLYGSQARKGTPTELRKWRYSQAILLNPGPVDPDVNTANLKRMVDTWNRQDQMRQPHHGNDHAAYAKSALEREIGRVMTAQPGTRNNTLNEAAFNLGTLVGAGVLDEAVVEASLVAAGVTAGLKWEEATRTTKSGLVAGRCKPRTIKETENPSSAKGAEGAKKSAETGPSVPKQPMDEGISCADLMALEMPEPRYAVAGLLPEGVTILAARPKMGKSWFALQIGLAVAQGAIALGDAKPIATEVGDVLYLALEDTRRRLKKRIRLVLKSTGWTAPHRLEFRVASDKSDKGGLAHIQKWLEAHPEARMVVIDTLAKFRPKPGGRGDTYADDYEMISGLKNLADRHAVAILVIHHSRKASAESPFDEVSGTLGLTGAADSCFVMQRSHGEPKAALYITGRDVEEETLTLEWIAKDCLWKLTDRKEGVNRPMPPEKGDKPPSPRVLECSQWLMLQLVHGQARESSMITEAEMNGFDKRLYYRARDNLKCIQFDGEGGKWVKLADFNGKK